ncbi:glycosyltransferase family 4 protein [Corynebacterium aquilae]|nr:glycosyltransferase family 4 protein [Corynebacterium aquilae]
MSWRDSQHPEGGGSERYVEAVAEYLARAGHDVVIRTARYTGSMRTSRRHGVTYSRAGGAFTVYPRGLMALAMGRMGIGPLRGMDAIIDVHNGIPFFATLVADCPVVLLSHHCHKEQWPVAGKVLGRIGWMLESKVSPRVHRNNQWVTVSIPSADELIELGVPAANITIIRNGCDPLPAAEVVAPATHDVHLVTLARLVPHKQLEHALDVVARLDRETDFHGRVTLDVVGAGWWEDKLRARADDLGLGCCVHFHGHVSEEYKHALLERSRVHLMPSAKEGWGITVMEAAQHGVPTIGYRAAKGLQDSIDHERTGLLADDFDQFYAHTVRVLQDDELRCRLGAAARDKAAGLNWTATGASMETVLKQSIVRG